MNSEIISHGKNGLLASSESEWLEALTQLIESAELRKKMGIAGRETVLEKYSVIANKQHYLDVFNSII